jgi:hypothetical protein
MYQKQRSRNRESKTNRERLGSSINNFNVLEGWGKDFCDIITKALVINTVAMVGRRGKNYSKLCDVIYGRSLGAVQNFSNDIMRPFFAAYL